MNFNSHLSISLSPLQETDTFDVDNLNFRSVAQFPYMSSGSMKHLYLYHHKSGSKSVYGLFNPLAKSCTVCVLDTVVSDQMPNLGPMYNAERNNKVTTVEDEELLPPAGLVFATTLGKNANEKGKLSILQRMLGDYKREKRGPTFIAVQSSHDMSHLMSLIPALGDFPLVPVHQTDSLSLYNCLDWQRVGCRRMLQHYLNSNLYIQVSFLFCQDIHLMQYITKCN